MARANGRDGHSFARMFRLLRTIVADFQQFGKKEYLSIKKDSAYCTLAERKLRRIADRATTDAGTLRAPPPLVMI